MKALIVYKSVHQGNTEKVAEAMGEVLNAELVEPEEVKVEELWGYDLVGFGSGIYHRKHHESLLNLAEKLQDMDGKDAFIFSTSGLRKIPLIHNFDEPLKKKLTESGFNVIDSFSCRGFDEFGPLKRFGGIQKGRPDEKDLRKARDFAEELKEKLF